MTKPNIRTERVANMRRLIAALIERELSSAECAKLLGMSTSGTRGYTQQLISNHIAEGRIGGTTHVTNHFRIYDEECAAAFLHQLANPKAVVSTAGAPSNYHRAIKDPARHIHLAADDEPTYPRVRNITPAKPDPQALPRDFFAPPVVAASPKLFVPRLPEPVGFAALDVRFERRAG